MNFSGKLGRLGRLGHLGIVPVNVGVIPSHL